MNEQPSIIEPVEPTARKLRHVAVDHARNAVIYGLVGRKGLSAAQKAGRLLFAKAEFEQSIESLDAALKLIFDANEGLVPEPFSLDTPDPADVAAIADEEGDDDEDA
jgi:hypothetical protein